MPHNLSVFDKLLGFVSSSLYSITVLLILSTLLRFSLDIGSFPLLLLLSSVLDISNYHVIRCHCMHNVHRIGHSLIFLFVMHSPNTEVAKKIDLSDRMSYSAMPCHPQQIRKKNGLERNCLPNYGHKLFEEYPQRIKCLDHFHYAGN